MSVAISLGQAGELAALPKGRSLATACVKAVRPCLFGSPQIR